MSDKLFYKTQFIIEGTADRYRMRQTVLAAEAAYQDKESGLVIGHSKALVEGMCKSMLAEYKVDYPSNIKIGRLAKKALDVFQVAKGVDNEKTTVEAFKKIVSGSANNFESIVHGIGTLRNEFCPLAHGKPEGHVPLDLYYAEFIAKQADSIIGFIYELRESFITAEPRSAPSKDSDFDDFLNDAFDSVTIYENTYLPSEILFNVSPEEYQKTLEEHKESLEEEVQ